MQINIKTVLNKLKKSVRQDDFEFVSRIDRSKSPVISKIAKIIVQTFKETDFVKFDLDHNGSGDYVWIFISDDGIRYYIKFKFLENDRVKFISFHEAE